MTIGQASKLPTNQTKSQGREPLLKGKDQYRWPPCTKEFRSAAFYIENLFFLFTKQPILMRRSIVLSREGYLSIYLFVCVCVSFSLSVFYSLSLSIPLFLPISLIL
jgi:hypothetical protein